MDEIKKCGYPSNLTSKIALEEIPDKRELHQTMSTVKINHHHTILS